MEHLIFNSIASGARTWVYSYWLMENSWLLSAAVVTSCSPIDIGDREMHKTEDSEGLHPSPGRTPEWGPSLMLYDTNSNPKITVGQ